MSNILPHLEAGPSDAWASNAQAHGGLLRIDLTALKDNYRSLRDRSMPAETGAAVKGDGYGLGLEPVTRALHAAGCRTFFVAHLSEAERIRTLFGPADANVYVLNGFLPDTGPIYCALDARPVLGSLEEIDEWRSFACDAPKPPAALHLDSGFTRLGLSTDESAALVADESRLAGIDVALLISHLACADTPDHAMNTNQLDSFGRFRSRFPGVPASIANSGGVFLGEPFHLDVVRPGIALYGGEATGTGSNRMRAVVSLHAPIVQLREAAPGETVGYGATYRFESATRVALVSLGYADGFFRSLGGSDAERGGRLFVEGQPCPVVGRVSMDITAIDVTNVPGRALRRGRVVEVIGPHQSVDDLARDAGTIGYEILTRLGLRFSRVYSGA